MAPTSRETAPRPRNRLFSAPLASAWATSASEGWADGDLVGVFGVGGGGEHVVDGVDLVGARAEVDLGRVPVEAEVLLRGGVSDEHRGVDFGGEHGGVEDAGEVEPLPAGCAARPSSQPDPLSRVDPVDAQAPGGGGAEHGDRLAGGGRVQEPALGHRGADGAGQCQAGGLHGQGVGVDRGDQRAAVGGDVADGAGVIHGGDRPDARDHAGCGDREFGGVAAEGLPVGDGEQVGAQFADLVQQPGLGGGREAEHGDDRGDADGDAERG